MTRFWKCDSIPCSLLDVLYINFLWIFINIVQTSEIFYVHWANSRNNHTNFWILIDVYISPRFPHWFILLQSVKQSFLYINHLNKISNFNEFKNQDVLISCQNGLFGALLLNILYYHLIDIIGYTVEGYNLLEPSCIIITKLAN